jgi:choline dehydrogenase
VALAGLEIGRRLLRTAPLTDWVDGELAPGDRAADLEAFARERAQGFYHPVGTCRMGSDPLAVVDPALRVPCVEALRVVDASVVPTMVRGHTNAPTIAVAERAAAIIAGRVPSPVASAVVVKREPETVATG